MQKEKTMTSATQTLPFTNGNLLAGLLEALLQRVNRTCQKANRRVWNHAEASSKADLTSFNGLL